MHWIVEPTTEQVETRTAQCDVIYKISDTQWTCLRKDEQLVDVVQLDSVYYYRINTGVWVRTTSTNFRFAFLKAFAIIWNSRQ